MRPAASWRISAGKCGWRPPRAGRSQLLRDTWRDQLGLVVTLKGVTGEEVQRDVASGEFTIAMVTLKSDRNDAMGLLRQWASGSKEGEFFYSHAYETPIWRMPSVCCWRRGMYAPCILPARAAGSAAPTRGY